MKEGKRRSSRCWRLAFASEVFGVLVGQAIIRERREASRDNRCFGQVCMYISDIDNGRPKLHSVGDSIKLPFTWACGMCSFVCVRLCLIFLPTVSIPWSHQSSTLQAISGHISVEKCDYGLSLLK